MRLIATIPVDRKDLITILSANGFYLVVRPRDSRMVDVFVEKGKV